VCFAGVRPCDSILRCDVTAQVDGDFLHLLLDFVASLDFSTQDVMRPLTSPRPWPQMATVFPPVVEDTYARQTLVSSDLFASNDVVWKKVIKQMDFRSVVPP
jgi:hypothetical protein